MTMAMDYSDLSILDEPAEEEIIPNPTISVSEASDTYGKFVVGPLEPGYGVTLGNPMRRVLYNSLPGAAITWVKIENILHEYMTVENVKEEVSEILLNIKSIRIHLVNNLTHIRLRFLPGNGSSLHGICGEHVYAHCQQAAVVSSGLH